MSFTNKTANYELPQWLADDKPTFLSDLNGAFSDIDAAMKANENAAASAQSTADANTLSINGITTDLDGAGGVKARLSAVETAESNLEGSVNTINSLIGNGTPTTTDQTIIGAINEIVAFTGEGPLDTTAQTVTGAINELAAGGNVGALDDLSDVDITTPANGDTLVYDSANSKWVNQAGGASTGYSFDPLVVANLVSTNTKDAIKEYMDTDPVEIVKDKVTFVKLQYATGMALVQFLRYTNTASQFLVYDAGSLAIGNYNANGRTITYLAATVTSS